MKHSRIFVGLIFFFSLILLVLNLPIQYTASIDRSHIPFLSDPTQQQAPIEIPVIQPYKLGLDLQGGARLTYDLKMDDISDVNRENALESTRSIIDQRINVFGVSESVIQTIKTGNESRIVVELPGVTDVNQAIDLIGKTAQLSFWEPSQEDLSAEDATSSAYPLGATFFLNGKKPVQTQLTGKDLEAATVGFNPQNGATEVVLNFTPQGTKFFADITKRNVGNPVLIVLDNEVIQAPVVQSEIPNGQASITGGYTTEQAKTLSIALNAGALPVPLELVAQSNVGPSLGIASLQQSLFAGILGLVSVVFFMVLIYKKEGLLASLALLVYTLIVLFIFKIVPVTLTLAGIAGFILSVGMAVDANILIFERMKEELRAGKTKSQAIEQGFKRAWTSIRDSNISSLITCLILFYFGTGIVRGFALTLAIGIFVSMFSAIIVTRNFLRVFDGGNIKNQSNLGGNVERKIKIPRFLPFGR
ncbi:MAG TPA: protein translocase subunit SecD [Candidatus Levybacteria bacterium]|nr:protein translocase subunit SecD [Candidatus Levybacteria bacterium]